MTATIDDVVDDDTQNDAESQRRLWSTAAPRATRHSSAPVNDDLQRKRKRALTADRGRRVLGSRRRDELRGILKNIDDTRMRRRRRASAEYRGRQPARSATERGRDRLTPKGTVPSLRGHASADGRRHPAA